MCVCVNVCLCGVCFVSGAFGVLSADPDLRPRCLLRVRTTKTRLEKILPSTSPMKS